MTTIEDVLRVFEGLPVDDRIERGWFYFFMCVIVVFLLWTGWTLGSYTLDKARADERAKWAKNECGKIGQVQEWTLNQPDGREIFLRCKVSRAGL